MTQGFTSRPWQFDSPVTWQPPDLDWDDLGHRLVEYLQDPANWHEDFENVEAIKVAYYDRAAEPLTNSTRQEPALLMTFHQGRRRFGMLITIERLVYQSGDDDVIALAGNVQLAVNEPQPGIDGEMVWFNSLPTSLHY